MLRRNRAVITGTMGLALILCPKPARALQPDRELTQYVHRIWQSQQGLPEATVVDIFQSRAGYLWLATEAGLVRFDGVRFTPAERLLPELPAGTWSRSVFEDDAGTLWLATNENGVYAFGADGRTRRFR